MTALGAGPVPATTSKTTNVETLVLCDDLCQDFEDVFRHGGIVDANESFRFRVDFEAFVEAQRRSDRVGTCVIIGSVPRSRLQGLCVLTARANLLSLRYLAHEVCFPLFEICWESLLERLFHGTLDFFLLLFALYLCFFLCYPSLLSGFSFQSSAEPRIGSPFVIKVDCVSCSGKISRADGRIEGLGVRGSHRRHLFGKRIPRKPVTRVPAVMATMVDVFMVVIWSDMVVGKNQMD